MSSEVKTNEKKANSNKKETFPHEISPAGSGVLNLKKGPNKTIMDSKLKERTNILPERPIVKASGSDVKNEFRKAAVIASVPTISSSMTVAQLKDELKVRYGDTKGLSGKSKAWFLDNLKVGSQVEGSIEWQQKAEEESQKLHVHNSLCHDCPLADSSLLRAPKCLATGTQDKRKRNNMAICDHDNYFFCRRVAYRSCEKCDFDICEVCFDIYSLPAAQRKQIIEDKYHERYEAERKRIQRERIRQANLEKEWQEREKQRQLEKEREYAEDLEKFPEHVKNPGVKHTNIGKKLKFTVEKSTCYKRETLKVFDTSYATLEEANQRVEYVFYFENEWGLEKDEMHAECDRINASQGTRLMSCAPGDSGRFTVSAIPSSTYDFMTSFENLRYHSYSNHGNKPPTSKTKFSPNVRNPGAKHTNQDEKLEYTVWKSNGYEYDGWHSYDGPPRKEFDSSYDTLKEANERVEYVFYHENIWGIGLDEIYAECDKIDASYGTRVMSCMPADSERWTVSVAPSSTFDFMVSEENLQFNTYF